MTPPRRKLVALDDPLTLGAPTTSGYRADPNEARRDAALYVRLRVRESDRLARAAFEVKAHKREIVGALIAHYVDGETDEGRAAVRELVENFRQICE